MGFLSSIKKAAKKADKALGVQKAVRNATMAATKGTPLENLGKASTKLGTKQGLVDFGKALTDPKLLMAAGQAYATGNPQALTGNPSEMLERATGSLSKSTGLPVGTIAGIAKGQMPAPGSLLNTLATQRAAGAVRSSAPQTSRPSTPSIVSAGTANKPATTDPRAPGAPLGSAEKAVSASAPVGSPSVVSQEGLLTRLWRALFGNK